MPIRVILFIFVMLCFMACSEQGSWPNRSFSSETWRNTPEEQRYELVNDLLRKQLLDGKSKAQVTELLGSPDSEAQDPRMLTYVVKTGGSSFNGSFNQVFILDIRFRESWDHVSFAGIRGD
ncbi:MAG TPA: hypothetical protein VFK88_01465 [Gallionella sp.]|nr:hypothetical protein [Gallionella sp.]